eukprot:scaffold183156_cov20-Prasinocladus_malaysianus.AAC.1
MAHGWQKSHCFVAVYDLSRESAVQAVKYIEGTLSMKTEKLGKDCLINAAKTAMNSKIIGAESSFFAQMVVDAVQSVRTVNDMGDY